jgi:hypothetical protein
MREDLSREEVDAAIDRVVEELLEKAGVEGPPVDAIAVARRHLGLALSLDAPDQGRGRGRRALDPSELTPEQRQWVAAQEIGQHLRPSILRRLGIDPEERRSAAGASLVSLFAPRLLLPLAWFRDDAAAADYDVPALKERYPTASHEAIALRLLDLPEPCIITIVENDHVDRRRSNAWPVRKRLEPPEQACQRYVHEYSRPRVVRAGGWTVQGWPVHRPDWKREILRSVVEEGADGDAGAAND